MRKGERVILNEHVTEEVIDKAPQISADKLLAFYFASYLPVITDCLASIADSLEILTKDLEEKENKMTNHEKFIEIFGETNGKVKASEEWLGKKYVGPVTMTEREKFLDWLDKQPFISYKEDDSKGDVVYIYCGDDKTPIIRVSDFGKFPGTVYIRIDGLCGDKPLSFVKEVVMRASSERMDKHLDFFDGLYNEIFRR